ncbi:uncharacterized protein COLE_05123 [Cutaneotrichosporon oleaginosum]|uniref:uncharacterized protein n=1 Tax=Cutaneotrichosporon oleaginosum TaxID=879819 RepID=UPI00132679DF|nr:hypothetical protein COLE_05123 [Cutaneotrichosporon oleaginosum]
MRKETHKCLMTMALRPPVSSRRAGILNARQRPTAACRRRLSKLQDCLSARAQRAPHVAPCPVAVSFPDRYSS